MQSKYFSGICCNITTVHVFSACFDQLHYWEPIKAHSKPLIMIHKWFRIMDMLYMVWSAFVLTGSFWSQISEGSPGSRALFHPSTTGWQRKRRPSWESVDLSKFWKWELFRGRGYIRGGGHAACRSEGAGWYTHASIVQNGSWEFTHFSAFYLIFSLMAGFSVDVCHGSAEEAYTRAPDETKEERQAEKGEKNQRKAYH